MTARPSFTETDVLRLVADRERQLGTTEVRADVLDRVATLIAPGPFAPATEQAS